MQVDKSIIAAIEQSVSHEGESNALAKALLSWIDSLNKGETRLENWNETDRRIELILGVLRNDN